MFPLGVKLPPLLPQTRTHKMCTYRFLLKLQAPALPRSPSPAEIVRILSLFLVRPCDLGASSNHVRPPPLFNLRRTVSSSCSLTFDRFAPCPAASFYIHRLPPCDRLVQLAPRLAISLYIPPLLSISHRCSQYPANPSLSNSTDTMSVQVSFICLATLMYHQVLWCSNIKL